MGEKGNSRKGYWTISNSSKMHKALGNSNWSSQGLNNIHNPIVFNIEELVKTIRTRG